MSNLHFQHCRGLVIIEIYGYHICKCIFHVVVAVVGELLRYLLPCSILILVVFVVKLKRGMRYKNHTLFHLCYMALSIEVVPSSSSWTAHHFMVWVWVSSDVLHSNYNYKNILKLLYIWIFSANFNTIWYDFFNFLFLFY